MKMDEFVRRLAEMEAKYPGDAGDALEKGAKKMTRAIRKATPVGKTDHPHKLKKSWRIKMVDVRGKAPRAEIRNTAPHYHLVNRGVQNPKDSHGHPKPELAGPLNRHKGFLEKAVRDNWPGVKKTMERAFYKKVRDRLG